MEKKAKIHTEDLRRNGSECSLANVLASFVLK